MIDPAVVLAAFALSLLLPAATRIHPAYGCLLPFVAALGFALFLSIWPIGNSTAPAALPFIFMDCPGGRT